MYNSFKFPNVSLRIQCFIIGYINLFVSVLDIIIHVVIVYILTGGFQCDVTEKSLSLVNWPWLERILFMLNLGTHGFAPFPLPLRTNHNLYEGYLSLMEKPKCYPGMVHVYLVDVLNFLINLIWLKFAKTYVNALHKKEPEPMRMFVAVCVVKILLQVLHFGDKLELRIMNNLQPFWVFRLFDICMSAFLTIIIYQYMKQLKNEKSRKEQTSACVEHLLAQYKDNKNTIIVDVNDYARKCPDIVISKDAIIKDALKP
ncbi:uncharacterized protein ACR2FA_003815 isoform 1-T2 [Aphomia sociella]